MLDLQFFSFFPTRLIRTLRKNVSKSHTISDIFQDTDYSLGFDSSNLDTLRRIKTDDPILLQFVNLKILYGYVGFLVVYERSNSCDGISDLFNALTMCRTFELVQPTILAISDALEIIHRHFNAKLFESISSALWDFFLNYPYPVGPTSHQHFHFLAIYFSRLIQLLTYDAGNITGRFSSFLAMLMLDRHQFFAPETVAILYDVMAPYLYSLKELALMMMAPIIPLIEPHKAFSYYQEIGRRFGQMVEEREPFIPVPPSVDCVTFQPRAAPDTLFKFCDTETFVDGLNILKRPITQTCSRFEMCCPAIGSVIDLLVRATGTNGELGRVCIESLGEFIGGRQDSPFVYDYMGVFVLLLSEVNMRTPIKAMQFPERLFDPRVVMCNLPAGHPLYAMRYFAVKSSLMAPDSNIDLLLLSLVRFPQIFSEVVEMVVLQFDSFRPFLLRVPRMLRNLRLMCLQLQFENVTSTESRTLIEQARMSLFRLLTEIFQDLNCAELFLNDILFMPFFLSVLFEPGVRPFVLSLLQLHISTAIERDSCAAIELNAFSTDSA
jgi:hypothetical protein